MPQVYVPDSLPLDSQPISQRYNDYTIEPTQVSQPHFSQTQTQGPSSQVDPRRKYWAVFIPTNADHAILKIPWQKPSLQIGRGPLGISGNGVVLNEKRISNRHCRITLGLNQSSEHVQSWRDGEAEPEVWLEDLNSSNGTFVNGERKSRVLLQHGDEVSLGHASTLDNHDVRFIYRSVGFKSAPVFVVGQVYEKYQLLDRLGKGTFAEVRRAVDVDTGSMRAVKQIVKHRFAGNAKTLALFQREIAICTALQHENICRLIEFFEDPQHICLVLEYVDGGDLLDYIMKWPDPSGLPEDHAATLTLQICRAMAYTHAMGVTHRDLKPENILLTKETIDSPATIKIADFGLAKMVDAKTMLTSMVGTPQYLAPEVVMQTTQNPGYENVVDSWSVGIIVYSMLTKALPFDEDAELPVDQRIRARFTQPFDVALLQELNITQTAITFISHLLAKSPAQRMSMAEALDDDWLAGPSSQCTDSTSHALGGDSVWEIQSFDGEGSVEEEDGSEGRWTRPATVSGTNMESGLVSDESFSQPMGNLRLTNAQFSSLSNAAHAHPLLTPPPSEVAPTLKRKVDKGNAFSSGSLSPPPTPTGPGHMADATAATHNGTSRGSPRRSTRARKSIRL